MNNPIEVQIPTGLRAFTGNRDRLDIDASSVRDALDRMRPAYPDLARHLFDEQAGLRSRIRMFVNGDPIDILRGLDTPLCSGDVLTLVPGLAGAPAAVPPAASPAEAISVRDLHHRLAGPEPPLLLDVRESFELDICRLEPALHIPMKEVRNRLHELDEEAEIVVFCRSGVRSARIAAFLRRRGFPRALNLTGGILAWADEIDPSLRKY